MFIIFILLKIYILLNAEINPAFKSWGCHAWIILSYYKKQRPAMKHTRTQHSKQVVSINQKDAVYVYAGHEYHNNISSKVGVN